MKRQRERGSSLSETILSLSLVIILSVPAASFLGSEVAGEFSDVAGLCGGGTTAGEGDDLEKQGGPGRCPEGKVPFQKVGDEEITCIDPLTYRPQGLGVSR